MRVGFRREAESGEMKLGVVHPWLLFKAMAKNEISPKVCTLKRGLRTDLWGWPEVRKMEQKEQSLR